MERSQLRMLHLWCSAWTVPSNLPLAYISRITTHISGLLCSNSVLSDYIRRLRHVSFWDPPFRCYAGSNTSLWLRQTLCRQPYVKTTPLCLKAFPSVDILVLCCELKTSYSNFCTQIPRLCFDIVVSSSSRIYTGGSSSTCIISEPLIESDVQYHFLRVRAADHQAECFWFSTRT
jgi:hypothetical protein